MARIIDDLHQDHRNFARLLDLLNEQLVLIQDEALSDFDLVLDMVEYIESYPDLFHHPKEDAIFDYYLEQGYEGGEALRELMQEHKQLKAMTAALRDSVEAILHDAMVERHRVVEQLGEYIREQRQHLDREEAHIFPLLRQTLSEEEWSQIEAQLPIATDPLFGEQVQRQFEALYDRITAAS